MYHEALAYMYKTKHSELWPSEVLWLWLICCAQVSHISSVICDRHQHLGWKHQCHQHQRGGCMMQEMQHWQIQTKLYHMLLLTPWPNGNITFQRIKVLTMGIIMSLEWLFDEWCNYHSVSKSRQCNTVNTFGANFRSLDTWIERGFCAGYSMGGVLALSTGHKISDSIQVLIARCHFNLR